LSKEPLEADTSLRWRLLFGSVSLAVIVSAIFISVAYELSSDLGDSIELENTHELAAHIETHLSLNTSELSLNPTSSEYFKNKHLFSSISDQVKRIEVWFAEEHITVRPFVSDAYPTTVIQVSKLNAESSGFIENEGGRFSWAYKVNSDSGVSVLIVRQVDTLSRALEYVAQRLSITAFLTFWLAVWAALVMSALIAKRFEKSNQKLSFMATHDDLTGLPNRYQLMSVLNKFLDNAKALEANSERSTGALMLIDLDKFKEVNDTMGHSAGDKVLASISERLIDSVGTGAEVFRYGGDEFIVWLKGADCAASEILAKQIVKDFRQPLLIENNQFEVGASVGVVCYPKHGKTIENLFKHADIAMYHAKKLRLGYQLFNQALSAKSKLWVKLKGQLNNALGQNQFTLYYQPKVNLTSKEITGVEALVRWEHPEEGLLTPGTFINMVEQSSIVHKFTRYVLQQAILQCRLWLNEGIRISIAVNLSPYNLRDKKLIPFLRQQLLAHQVPAGLIEIELTESGTMLDVNAAQTMLLQLRAEGVKLSIDDFGTGMSSLAYIKKLNVNYIKIDRSFITNIQSDHRDEAIVKSILSLCADLDKQVIAEGIETLEQAEKLSSLGCNLGQGYYFGKPVHPIVITPLLTKGKMLKSNITNIRKTTT
jgi:diguanylate cyclase (GGDEF)-like protein